VTGQVQLGTAYEDALRYALVAHAGQTRKHTDIPYISHLLAVSGLVLEAGGSEIQAIAALLHDAPEDCGGQPRLDDIRHRFGNEVGEIVKACSDSLVEDADDKKDWCTRKKEYIAHLDGVAPNVLLVSLADKVHNVTAILRDFRTEGIKMFGRFTIGQKDGPVAGRAATEWYYGELVTEFTSRHDDLTPGGVVLLKELRRTLDTIRQHPAPAPCEAAT
jgi:(p)ppGpp synthase/HD superfamily hydrolase